MLDYVDSCPDARNLGLTASGPRSVRHLRVLGSIAKRSTCNTVTPACFNTRERRPLRGSPGPSLWSWNSQQTSSDRLLM